MKVLQGREYSLKNSAVSLGKFDGLHLGHRLLMKEIQNHGKLNSVVFTFELDINSKIQGKSLYTQKEKDYILEELNIDYELLFPLDEEAMAMEPEDFVKRILVDELDAKFICVGEDFRFGKDRVGDVKLLMDLSHKYGFEVCARSKLPVHGEVVSSTRVRELLGQGKMRQVNELLGRDYFILGEVVHGNELGRTLEMPTANIILAEEKVTPRLGVYASKVLLSGKEYYGITNIGCKPTVGQHQIGVETYIFDFNEDIYGMKIIVELKEFIRPEVKFSSLDELKNQMRIDKEKVKMYFSI